MAAPLSYRPARGEIPAAPGVYRFIDEFARVLYVGKAKNLRSRLSNYFAPLDTLHLRTQKMVTRASRVDWTVVGSDAEALLLEHTWINEFSPPYNIMFRDDKTYPYLVVSLGHEAPRLFMSRTPGIRGARYFGPFPHVWAVKESLKLLQQAFPIRTCNESDYKQAIQSNKPCLAGQINRCNGPCSQRVTVAEHRAMVNNLMRFLSGQDRQLLRELRESMTLASAELRFEDAALLRDQIESIQLILEKNAVVLNDSLDADVFGLAVDELSASVQQFTVRDGRIRGERNWIVDLELDDSPAELIKSIIQTVYDSQQPAALVLVPTIPAEAEALAPLLGELHQCAKPEFRVPKRGEAVQLLERARTNAQHQLSLHRSRRRADLSARTAALSTLQTELGMKKPPLRIECVDISHLQGTNVVGALVVAEDGLPVKAAYRKFSIPHSRDDTDSMYQVISRRAAQLNAELDEEQLPGAFRSRPQLLVVDGGVPQVNAAWRALQDAGVHDVTVCGIAKRLEEIWLPGQDYPIILPRNSDALFLLQQMRDEAHAFAIRYQRKKRSSDIRSELSDVPGLGPAKVAELLRAFGSLSKLRAASHEELCAVAGIGPVLAQTISESLTN